MNIVFIDKLTNPINTIADFVAKHSEKCTFYISKNCYDRIKQTADEAVNFKAETRFIWKMDSTMGYDYDGCTAIFHSMPGGTWYLADQIDFAGFSYLSPFGQSAYIPKIDETIFVDFAG